MKQEDGSREPSQYIWAETHRSKRIYHSGDAGRQLRLIGWCRVMTGGIQLVSRSACDGRCANRACRRRWHSWSAKPSAKPLSNAVHMNVSLPFVVGGRLYNAPYLRTAGWWRIWGNPVRPGTGTTDGVTVVCGAGSPPRSGSRERGLCVPTRCSGWWCRCGSRGFSFD